MLERSSGKGSMVKLFYLYYNNEEAFQFVKDHYGNSGVPVVIVDDGSPVPLSSVKKDPSFPELTVFRIDDDIKWGMSRANNYGMGMLAHDDIILRCDIDHYFEVEDIVKLCKSIVLEEKQIIKFDRIVYNADGSSYYTPSPPNIYLCRVGDILDAGGYDERFCGHYGFEDKELMYRLEHKCGFKVTHCDHIYSKCNSWMGTGLLDRDTTINYKLYLSLVKK